MYETIFRAGAAAVAAQILLENFFRKHKFIDVSKPRLGTDDVSNRNATHWVLNTYPLVMTTIAMEKGHRNS